MAAMNILPAVSHGQRTAPGSLVLDIASSYDFPESLSVQPDGSLLIAGASILDAEGALTGASFVVRLRPDGQPDARFGVDGRLALAREGNAVTVQPDGALLLQQPSQAGGQPRLGLVRLQADGTPDLAFNANAAAAIPGEIGSDMATVTVNGDGSIRISAVSETGLTVLQLAADGTLDTGFGNNGTAQLAGPRAFGSSVRTAALDDGQFLLGGRLYWDGDDHPYAITRVNADGAVDAGFGDNGYKVLASDVLASSQGDIVVREDGKVLLAGGDDHSADFKVIRLNADGGFDETFGDQGVATVDVQGDSDWSLSAAPLPDGKIVVVGTSSYAGTSDLAVARLNPDGSLDTHFASADGGYHLVGSAYADTLDGHADDETLQGFEGNDLLQGRQGHDRLEGGAGADVFRLLSLADSYLTEHLAASDRVLDFNPREDRIDLVALGFNGLGSGHDGTLAVRVNAAGTRTYLKDFDSDAQGHRFELVLEGNLAGQLDAGNVLTSAAPITGTAGADVLSGTIVDEVLRGLAGNDRMEGAGGSDLLEGGLGRDRLSGGSGNDLFRFTTLADSYRTALESFSDALLDFSPDADRIDVSALGFTALGDGTDGTLKPVYDYFLERTYLKSFDADADGRRFEVSLPGDHLGEFYSGTIVFAPAEPVAPVLVALGASPGAGEPAAL